MGHLLTKCLRDQNNQSQKCTPVKIHQKNKNDEEYDSRDIREELRCSSNLARTLKELADPVVNVESRSNLSNISNGCFDDHHNADLVVNSIADGGETQNANDQSFSHRNENNQSVFKEFIQTKGEPREGLDNPKEGVSQELDLIGEDQNSVIQNVDEGLVSIIEEGGNAHSIANPTRQIVYKGVLIGLIGWNHPRGRKLRTLTVSQKTMLSEFATRAASFADYISQRSCSSRNTAHLVDEIDSILKDIANIEVFRDFTNVRTSIRRVEKKIQSCAIEIRARPITADDLAHLSRCANWATGVVSQLSNSTPRGKIDQLYKSIIDIYDAISCCSTWEQFDMININLKNVTDAINEFSNTNAAFPQ